MENPAAIENTKEDSGLIKCLLFMVGNDIYGLEVNRIHEVIGYSQLIHLTRITIVNESVYGIINLRGKVIPVIDISVRLYNRNTEIRESTSIIVIEISDGNEDITVGVIVDGVRDVAKLPESDIVNLPEFGAKIRPEFINKIVKIDDLFAVMLNIDRLFNIDELCELTLFEANAGKLISMRSGIQEELTFNNDSAESRNDAEEIIEEHEFVTFSIGEEIYAIDMENIQEIMSITRMTRVPNTLQFMKGVINLRDSIVPVVDMRERCGFDYKEYDKFTPVLIIECDDLLIGLAIDSVNAVIKFPVDKIQYPPHYSAKIDSDFIEGMLQNNNKIIIILNIRKILSPEETSFISKNVFKEQEQING
ncbi:MAG: chemotaxis protein CheW [Spirochaetota bacterium]